MKILPGTRPRGATRSPTSRCHQGEPFKPGTDPRHYLRNLQTWSRNTVCPRAHLYRYVQSGYFKDQVAPRLSTR